MAFKTVKVTILPTNEVKGDFSKERIYPCLLKHSWMFDKEEKGKLIFADSNIRTPTQLQNLYFLSDDEIKEGDWIYENNLNQETQIYQVYKRDNKLGFFRFRNVWIPLSKQNSVKKVIATTDVSLEIFDKELSDMHSVKVNILLPQPSQQFIQKYVEEYNKGNIITDVLVEYDKATYDKWFNNGGQPVFDTVKINPKDNSLNICFID